MEHDIDTIRNKVIKMVEVYDDYVCQRVANESNKDAWFQQIRRAREAISERKKQIESNKREYKKEEKLQKQHRDQIREFEMSKSKIDKQVQNIKIKIMKYAEMKSEITDDTVILEYKKK